MLSDQYNTSCKLFYQIGDGPNESRIAAYLNRVLKSIYEADTSFVIISCMVTCATSLSW